MLHRTTNRIRPTLEALEVREVYFAGVALGIPVPPVMGPLPPICPFAPVGQLGPYKGGLTKDDVIRPANSNPAPQLNQVDSVITLRNDTAATVHLAVRWKGSTEVTRYALLPGQSERVTFRQTEVIRTKMTAQIVYTPEARGAMPRKIQVSAGLAAVGEDGTSQGDGKTYAFKQTPAGGVGLFTVPPPHTTK